LVRELEESKYQIVAGARRLRAAKLAELEKLPVRVVKLTDAEAIEAQCVICSWQELSLLIRSAARRSHVNDVPRSQFAVANHRWNLNFRVADQLRIDSQIGENRTV